MRRRFLHCPYFGLCALGVLALCGPAPAQVSSTPKRVFHLRVRGDLDNVRMANELAAQLRRASGEGAGLVVLEMDGDRWRADVVASMCRAVQGSAVPVAVYLADEKDRRVGAGAALVGLSAASCWIEKATDIVSGTGDDRRELAPKGTVWGEVEQAVVTAAENGQRKRGADARLARFLLKPETAMWAVEPSPGAAMLLSEGAPQSSGAGSSGFAARIAEQGGSGGSGQEGVVVSVRIRPEIATGLRLAKAVVARAGDVIAGEGVVARPLVSETIASGLGDAGRDLKRSMERADSALEQAERTLDVRVPDQRQNTDSLYREAGKAALGQTQQATGALDEAEGRLKDYPELVRTPAFGQTDIGRDADDREMEWRRVIQKRRDKVTKLETKARGYAAR